MKRFFALLVGLALLIPAFVQCSTPDFSDSKEEEAYWDEYNIFSLQIRDLTPATRYYYRALVVQRDHYTYGETKEFTTLPVSAMIETLDYAIEKEGYVTLKSKVDVSNMPYYVTHYGFYAGASEYNMEQISSLGGSPIGGIYSEPISDTRFSGSRIYYKAYLRLNDVEYFGELKCYEKSNQ